LRSPSIVEKKLNFDLGKPFAVEAERNIGVHFRIKALHPTGAEEWQTDRHHLATPH
jgi:hypothetical protein